MYSVLGFSLLSTNSLQCLHQLSIGNKINFKIINSAGSLAVIVLEVIQAHIRENERPLNEIAEINAWRRIHFDRMAHKPFF